MIYISNTRLLKYASTEKAVGPTINLEYVMERQSEYAKTYKNS